MIEREFSFLEKAHESLAGAESEFANGRYNNCVNRCYYSCFQAAIYALSEHAFAPSGAKGRSTWSHEALQANFVGELINRRKLYPAELRDVLARTHSLREAADYKREFVSETQASRALRRTRSFVETINPPGGDLK